MPMNLPDAVLYEGKYLRFVRRDGWEFIERPNQIGAAFIGAITNDGKILLIEEFRVPLNRMVIGCPAGLIGDTGDSAESLEIGVNRELEEETGYRAEKITLLSRGPTSPGQSTEVIELVLAEGLTKVGEGGGIHDEQIQLHEILLNEVDEWLKRKMQADELIDPKVYSILYFLRNQIP